MAPEDVLAEAHIIAYYYHWSEREIMSLPSRKRSKYVGLIADQVKRENGKSDDDMPELEDEDFDDYDDYEE